MSDFDDPPPEDDHKTKVAKARARGSEGGSHRKFRTMYALAAPDFNMYDALGVTAQDMVSVQAPRPAFPGCPPLRQLPLSRHRKAKSLAMLAGPSHAPRWWLHDVKNDKSGGEGLYEVVSGLVAMYQKPLRDSERLGVLRSGTRFRAEPYHIKGHTWLRMVKEEMNAPLVSTTSRGAVVHTKDGTGPSFGSSGQKDLLHCFHDRSGRAPLAAGVSSVWPKDNYEVLAGAEEVWLEDNKQYINRKRDIDREKGNLSYSVCSKGALRSSPIDGMRLGSP